MDPQSASIFMPPQASTVAAEVDYLYYFIHYLSVFFFVLVVGMMLVFMWRYRRRPGGPKVKQISHNTALEVTWSVIPLFLVVVIFWWGFRGWIDMSVAPRGAMEIQVQARKWAWSFEYPNGVRSDNEIHVPVKTPVKLIMSSQDVIHSFFVPDFRIKQDVVPGRYTTIWFEATQTGPHQVFCTEYCGDNHSGMLARVIVDTPEEYQRWLEQAASAGEELPLAELGARLYESKTCNVCHSTDGTTKIGPTFKGLFGRTEALADGSSVVVDEQYLRESITEPAAKIVQGFPPAMPAFKGQLSDRELNALVEFIKGQK